MNDKAQSEWITLQAAIELYDKGHKFVEPNQFDFGSNDPQIIRHNEFVAAMNRWFTAQGAAGLINFKGVKLPERRARTDGPIEVIPTEYFRTERAFLQRENKIQAATLEEPMKEFITKRSGGERHPDWIDVVLGYPNFRAALDYEVRDFWFDEIAHGRIEPLHAESYLKTHGYSPLNSIANPNDHLPTNEINWTIEMAVAWIAWRDIEMVAKNTKAFNEKGGYWQEIQIPNQTTRGFILENTNSSPSLSRLMIQEALEDQKQAPKLITIKDARIDLWRKLSDNKLVATGIKNKEARSTIDYFLWQDLRVFSSDTKTDYFAATYDSADTWRNITMPCQSILELWPIPGPLLSVWDFAQQKSGGDLRKAKRLVIEFYDAFWQGNVAPDGLTLLQDDLIKNRVDSFSNLSRQDLAEVALGQSEFKRLGFQNAVAELLNWNIGNYENLREGFRHYFLPESRKDDTPENKRGLAAPEDLLQKWYDIKHLEQDKQTLGFEKQSNLKRKGNLGNRRTAVAHAMDELFGKGKLSPDGVSGLDRNNRILAKITEMKLTAPATNAALQKAIEREIKNRKSTSSTNVDSR